MTNPTPTAATPDVKYTEENGVAVVETLNSDGSVTKAEDNSAKSE